MTGKQVAKILENNGWVRDRIKGAHHIYIKEDSRRSIPDPIHRNKDIGVLANRILRQANITIQ